MAWLLNGTPQLDTGFQTGSPPLNYPKGWIRNASPSERAAIGITEAPIPKPYNSKYSAGWNSDETAQIWESLTELRSNFDSEDDQMARQLISGHCQRYVEKNALADIAIPDSVKQYRTDVLAAFTARKTARDGVATTEALQTLMTGDSYTPWPASPDASRS